MIVRHPRAVDEPGNPPAKIDINGKTVSVDRESSGKEYGTFEVENRAWLNRWADNYGYEPEDLIVGEGDDGGDVDPGDTICTCDVNDGCDECGGKCPTVKANGEVCGRDRPCTYHDDEEE